MLHADDGSVARAVHDQSTDGKCAGCKEYAQEDCHCVGNGRRVRQTRLFRGVALAHGNGVFGVGGWVEDDAWLRESKERASVEFIIQARPVEHLSVYRPG